VGISVDDRQHARQLWEQRVNRKFTILSDPDAKVIRTYGLLHIGRDIALDTTLLVDAAGRERWRKVSETLPDLPSTEEVLNRIRTSQTASRNSKKTKSAPKRTGCGPR